MPEKMTTWIKNKKTVIVILIILIAGGSYLWFNRSNDTSAEMQYVTEKASKGMLTSSVSATGSIIVDQQATVDPTITGTVADLAVEVGDKVEKGQLLFNIVNDDLSVNATKASASLQQAQNSLESARLSKNEAENDYDKAKEEDEDDGDAYTKEELQVLKDKIDLAENGVTYAEKNLAASQASYRNELANSAKRQVTAPIAGTIQEINVKNGDDLSRTSSNSDSSAPIIIGDPETLKASVDVNEVDIANVAVGQKAVITLDALSETEFTGKVEKIDSLGTVEQGVVSYNVTISFDTLDSKVKPDMSLSASIITDVKQGVLMVTSGAVKNDGNGDYVEVMENGSLRRQTVSIGISNDTSTEIIAGLKEGEEVVTQTISAAQSSGTSSSNNQSGGGSSIRIPGMGGMR